MTLYQAWTQAQGYLRAALVPRVQLLRRVRVTVSTRNIRADALATAPIAGTAKLNDVFEITVQKSGLRKIDNGKWISLGYEADI